MSKALAQTFSGMVKCELASQSFSSVQEKAALAGFVHHNATPQQVDSDCIIDLSTEHGQVAEFLHHAISEGLRLPCRYSCVTSSGAKKNMRFHVIVSRTDMLFEKLGLSDSQFRVPSWVFNEEDLIPFYVAGAFLSRGYVNDPQTTNYHLEFCFDSESYSFRFNRMLNRICGGNYLFKSIKRRGQSIIYIKKSEKISEFLSYIGASNSCLMFENIRIDRDFANIGNRLSNLDKANETKKSGAAAKQTAEILALQEKGLLGEVNNPKVEILCNLRIDNPDASMDELAEMLSEEMGMGVSKSNVNHLFRFIHSLWEKHFLDDDAK